MPSTYWMIQILLFTCDNNKCFLSTKSAYSRTSETRSKLSDHRNKLHFNLSDITQFVTITNLSALDSEQTIATQSTTTLPITHCL